MLTRVLREDNPYKSKKEKGKGRKGKRKTESGSNKLLLHLLCTFSHFTFRPSPFLPPFWAFSLSPFRLCLYLVAYY